MNEIQLKPAEKITVKWVVNYFPPLSHSSFDGLLVVTEKRILFETYLNYHETIKKKLGDYYIANDGKGYVSIDKTRIKKIFMKRKFLWNFIHLEIDNDTHRFSLGMLPLKKIFKAMAS